MNIIERGRAFLQSLKEMASRTVWDWRRCPYCGDTLTCKWGSYVRQPWGLGGRQQVRVQRHWCERCRHTYSETSPLLVRGGWYAREVRRAAVDTWQYGGTSLRRTAELLRSWLGRQERWLLWRPLDPVPGEGAQCHLAASTVERWLNGAGRTAQRTVPGQLEGIASSGQVGTDGLWARLRGGAQRVVLALTDSVSGLVWPPVVVSEEATAGSWEQLFERAKGAGLNLEALRGVTSDGAVGLASYLEQVLTWVNHQRCEFHIWRSLGGELGRQVAQAVRGLAGAALKGTERRVRRELVALVHGVLDAGSGEAAEQALARLAAHPQGADLARTLAGLVDAALVYRLAFNEGLARVGPEWLWRDFRLRLSHGRNHRSPERLEQAALVWAIYRNFEPAQRRSERKRYYRRAGRSPLEMAGAPPGRVSYLDALAV
jgi:hypothetical protein